jgi:uncharacterized protein YjaZ
MRIAMLAFLAGLAMACDRSSPTEPRDQQPVVAIAFDTVELEAQRALITELVHEAVDITNGALRVGSVSFTVGVDRHLIIPGWGIGGATAGPDQVRLVVDPALPGLAQVLESRLPPLVGHELHHVVRWRGVGSPQTLLELMVTEGLADHFSVERFGTPPPPWADALSEAQVTALMARAMAELDSTTFDRQAWFFGLGVTDLPRWTGYTLGYRLVGDYLARHPGASAAGLVHAPAEVFRPV